MTATVIKMSIQRMICTGCGAEANASCNCGKAYLPKSVQAAEALRANPEKSDRAIAKEIGVSGETVRQARMQLPSELAVDERIGLDGKTRRLPQYEEEEGTVEDDILPQNIRTAYLLRADQAKQFAVYSGRVTTEIVATAQNVAAAWMRLANELQEELKHGKKV